MGSGYTLGINKFADLSAAEFDSMQGLRVPVADPTKFLNGEVEEEGADESDGGRRLQSYPASLDWRSKGVLNPIRSQGSCGGCYSFSSICSLEAIYKIKKGSLPMLSE